MKFLLDLFNTTKNRKSIPSNWCGLWKDCNGKQLIIEETKHNFYLVTILDGKGEPFQITLLGDKLKYTEKLMGEFRKDHDGNPVLQVEAGSIGIGPTYELYFLALSGSGKNLAKSKDDLEELVIIPTVGMGLYDDWEDDLGVPWAFPLNEFKKY